MDDQLIRAILSSALVGNALPHLIRGVTRERYPTFVGYNPIANIVVAALSLALAWFAIPSTMIGMIPSFALGALALALIHATGGAYALAGLFKLKDQ